MKLVLCASPHVTEWQRTEPIVVVCTECIFALSLFKSAARSSLCLAQPLVLVCMVRLPLH